MEKIYLSYPLTQQTQQAIWHAWNPLMHVDVKQHNRICDCVARPVSMIQTSTGKLPRGGIVCCTSEKDYNVKYEAKNSTFQKTVDETTLWKNFASLCYYLKVSPTKWKRQRRVRCGAGGPGRQGHTGVGAAVRSRTQDYRITRWPTWTGGRRERGGESRHGRPRVLKTKRERERVIFQVDREYLTTILTWLSSFY